MQLEKENKTCNQVNDIVCCSRFGILLFIELSVEKKSFLILSSINSILFILFRIRFSNFSF